MFNFSLFVLCLFQEIEEEDADDVNVQDEGEVEISSGSQILKKGALTANLSKSKRKKSKGKRTQKTTLESTLAIEEESVDEMLERLVLENEESASTSDTLTVPGMSSSLFLQILFLAPGTKHSLDMS
jgi:hypothetical protein